MIATVYCATLKASFSGGGRFVAWAIATPPTVASSAQDGGNSRIAAAIAA